MFLFDLLFVMFGSVNQIFHEQITWKMNFKVPTDLITDLFLFSFLLCSLSTTNGYVFEGYESIHNSSAYNKGLETEEASPPERCFEVRIPI